MPWALRIKGWQPGLVRLSPVSSQDLWIPYFAVTTDISASAMRVHTDGECLLPGRTFPAGAEWLQGRRAPQTRQGTRGGLNKMTLLRARRLQGQWRRGQSGA